MPVRADRPGGRGDTERGNKGTDGVGNWPNHRGLHRRKGREGKCQEGFDNWRIYEGYEGLRSYKSTKGYARKVLATGGNYSGNSFMFGENHVEIYLGVSLV